MLGPDDSSEAHVEDTLRVGDGLCNREVVEMCVRRGPSTSCTSPTRWGWPSTATPTGSFDLGREGGHSARRIVHARDMTGAAIQTALLAPAADRRRPRSPCSPTTWRSTCSRPPSTAGPNAVFGAYVLDQTHRRGGDRRSRARSVLATGGAGKVYLYTSNPDVATGDGVAMAYRVGARVANMEFFQFHPTCLYHPAAKTFLISEALRGEGGDPAAARRHAPSWRATTRWRTSRRATSWRAPSTPS